MSNIRNSLFTIKFKLSGNERKLSRMDSDEVCAFYEEKEVAYVSYEGRYVCTAYYSRTNDSLEISNNNPLSLHFKEVIEGLMN